MSDPTVASDEAREDRLEVEAETREEFIANLRAYTAWLEANPDADLPAVYSCNHESTAKGMAKRAQQFGGKWAKCGDETWFELARNFGPSIKHGIFALRESVCERIVVGTEEREVCGPDPAAVAALPQVARTETIEKVEWRCPTLLAAEDSVLEGSRLGQEES